MKHHGKAFFALLCILFFFTFHPMFASISAAEDEASADPAKATFDLEAESFDYGEDITKVVIDMKEEIDPSSITVATFSVSVKDYPSYNWQTQKVVHTDVIDRKVMGVSVEGRYVTLALAHGFGQAGASTLMYDGMTWRNYPIELQYEVAQAAEFKRADGSTVRAGDKTYTQKGIFNKLVDQFDQYVDESGISYVLYEPANAADNAKYPLIVWLHGVGEGGFDNKVQVRGNRVVGLIEPEVQELFAGGAAFVLAPQCPTGWMEDNDHNNRSDYLEDVIALIEKTIRDHAIDTDKVYIGGCSMGGYMTWNVILTRPDLFAAAFPVCPAYTPTQEEMEAVVQLPIWITHSADDTTVRPALTSRLTVPALQQMGGNVRYTEFKKTDYNGHWSWQYVFNNYYSEEYGETIMEWLAAQDRTLNVHKPLPEPSASPAENVSPSEVAAEVSPSTEPVDDADSEDDLNKDAASETDRTYLILIVILITAAGLFGAGVLLTVIRKKGTKHSR